MKNKLIFIVVGSLKLGGTEKTATRVGLELLKRGFDVKFILLKPVFDYKDDQIVNNSIALTNNKYKSRLLNFLQAYFKFLLLLIKNRPFRLISFSFGANFFVFFFFYRKTIIRIETNIFGLRRWYKKYLLWLITIFPNISKIVVPSEGLTKSCKNFFLIPSKVVNIVNPISVSEVEEKANESISLEKQNYILSAGRFSITKGFEQLIRAFSNLKFDRDFKLIILGDGPLKNKLQNLIIELQLEDKVILKGFVTNPFPYYKHAKFFILNTSLESFGNVFIESLACGTPVLAGDCDFGPRDIIHNGYNGFLFEPNNILQMSELMNEILQKDIATLRLNAINSSKEYGINAVCNKWLQLFK